MNELNVASKFGLPHKIKVAEAFSVIADQRIHFVKPNCYEVLSSDHSKKYTVIVHGTVYSSNDNMSYNNNVLGYPIVAVLMRDNLIRYSPSVASKFRNICWTKVNLQYNKDFTKALENVLEKIAEDENDKNVICCEINTVFGQVEKILNKILHVAGNITFEESNIRL